MATTDGALPYQDDAMFRAGERFLRFFVVRLIGRGGISEVYEVLDRGHRCALKVLQRRFVQVARQKRRAEREGRLLVRIHHPNVIDVQEVGIHEGPGPHEGILFIRMELLRGVDLREAIHRIGPMSVGLAGAWIRQAAHGAHQCHVVGIVHRDLKPENIFLEPPRTVKILDLGIATAYDKRFATFETDEVKHTPVGTALYMAPEIATGDEPATPATDVYALGMTLREMLTGENVFFPQGSNYDYWAIVRRQVHGVIPVLTEEDDGIPAYLADVVARALSKDPRQRQPNGLAFANEVDAACKRYAVEYPGEDSASSEPAIAWLLEREQVPSFGTGPSFGRSGAPGARRPTDRERRSGRISGLRPSASNVALRFHTQPIVHLVYGEIPAELPPCAAVDLDPDGVRITDVMPMPLAVRRYDTISLPPEQRDPTAVRALAPYRRPRSAPAPRLPVRVAEPGAAPPTRRRGGLPFVVDPRWLALPLVAFCVLMLVVIARAARSVRSEVGTDAGVAAPLDTAPLVAIPSAVASAPALAPRPVASAKPVAKPVTKPVTKPVAKPSPPASPPRSRVPIDIF